MGLYGTNGNATIWTLNGKFHFKVTRSVTHGSALAEVICKMLVVRCSSVVQHLLMV